MHVHHLIPLLIVRALTASTVILIRLPITALRCPLVNDKALRPWRIKLYLDVVDLVRFAQVQCQIDRVRVLHALVHRLRLPPCDVSLVVPVVEKVGRVAVVLVVAALAVWVISVVEFAGFKVEVKVLGETYFGIAATAL